MASHAAVGCGCLGPSTALHLHLHLALHKLPACDSLAINDAEPNLFKCLLTSTEWRGCDRVRIV